LAYALAIFSNSSLDNFPCVAISSIASLSDISSFTGLVVVQQGKRGGKSYRQRTQIRENTPDASGNVFTRADKFQQECLTLHHA